MKTYKKYPSCVFEFQKQIPYYMKLKSDSHLPKKFALFASLKAP